MDYKDRAKARFRFELYMFYCNFYIIKKRLTRIVLLAFIDYVIQASAGTVCIISGWALQNNRMNRWHVNSVWAVNIIY